MSKTNRFDEIFTIAAKPINQIVIILIGAIIIALGILAVPARAETGNARPLLYVRSMMWLALPTRL
jgi:hypothetical protein